MSRLLAVAVIAAALALAACGDDNPANTSGAPAAGGDAGAAEGTATKQQKSSGAQAKNTGRGAEIKVAESQYGPVLFDGSRKAIYLFDKETSNRSACYGACAGAWPPVLTEGAPVAGDGADSKLMGTIERDDGSTQVTYDGHPLYHYVNDQVGKVLCHNVEQFGGLWLAVEPSGEAVQ